MFLVIPNVHMSHSLEIRSTLPTANQGTNRNEQTDIEGNGYISTKKQKHLIDIIGFLTYLNSAFKDQGLNNDFIKRIALVATNLDGAFDEWSFGVLTLQVRNHPQLLPFLPEPTMVPSVFQLHGRMEKHQHSRM